MIEIINREDYDLIKFRGYEPLRDWRNFELLPLLRIQLQKELFSHSYLSKTNVLKANDRYYHYAWKIALHHKCENCLTPLYQFLAIYVSHIISRGSRSEMAHDLRNHNLLCLKCHRQWEDEKRRKTMNIYPMNQLIIKLLKEDYYVQ